MVWTFKKDSAVADMQQQPRSARTITLTLVLLTLAVNPMGNYETVHWCCMHPADDAGVAMPYRPQHQYPPGAISQYDPARLSPALPDGVRNRDAVYIGVSRLRSSNRPSYPLRKVTPSSMSTPRYRHHSPARSS